MLNLELEMGDWATWVGSLGTLGAFTVAFWQIHRERTARQSRDLREAWMRRREHVDRVSGWVQEGEVHVNNGSGHPLHAVRVHDGDRTLALWPHLAPGLHRHPVSDRHECSAHMEFTDVRGDRWSRAPGYAPRLHSDAVGDRSKPA